MNPGVTETEVESSWTSFDVINSKVSFVNVLKHCSSWSAIEDSVLNYFEHLCSSEADFHGCMCVCVCVCILCVMTGLRFY
jgi:hypothetical protein